MHAGRFMQNPLRLVCFLMAVLLHAFALSACAPEQHIEEPTPLAVGDEAPDFSLVTAKGEVYRLEQFRGRKVILYFWTTWCPTCRAEMTELSERYRQNGLRGPMVLAINSEEEAGTVMDFGEGSGLPYPLLVDIDGRVGDMFGMQTIPSTYLIDEDGTIQQVNAGTMTQDKLDSLMLAVVPQTPTPMTPTVPPEPTAAPTATTIPSLNACVTRGILNVRSAPSTSADVLDGLITGECVEVDARTASGEWLRLKNPVEGRRGWASAKYMELNGPIDALTISE